MIEAASADDKDALCAITDPGLAEKLRKENSLRQKNPKEQNGLKRWARTRPLQGYIIQK